MQTRVAVAASLLLLPVPSFAETKSAPALSLRIPLYWVRAIHAIPFQKTAAQWGAYASVGLTLKATPHEHFTMR
jgi:hypothetical protein